MLIALLILVTVMLPVTIYTATRTRKTAMQIAEFLAQSNAKSKAAKAAYDALKASTDAQIASLQTQLAAAQTLTPDQDASATDTLSTLDAIAPAPAA